MGKTRKVHVSKEAVKERLKEREVSLRKVCKDCGLYYETIRPCIAKESIMPDDLVLIAEYLDTSMEYLQGIAEYPESYKVMKEIKAIDGLRKAGVIKDYLDYRLRISNYTFSDGSPVTEEILHENEMYLDAHINDFLTNLFNSVKPEYFNVIRM